METFECDPQRLAKLDRRVGGEVLHQESDFFFLEFFRTFLAYLFELKIKDETLRGCAEGNFYWKNS